uniref:Uncharacterized protein n=1 Tax=Setaria viridis TaxID=4556 RepID=A0A4U6UZB4_SETVI|nr:hypothetical protein SEVIR_4G168500v2 [Setaria viridis]
MHDSGTGGFQASCNSASGCPYGSRTTRAAGRPEAAHGRDERIDHRARRVLVGWLPAQRDHQIRCHGTAPKLLVLPCHALHCVRGLDDHGDGPTTSYFSFLFVCSFVGKILQFVDGRHRAMARAAEGWRKGWRQPLFSPTRNLPW